MSNERENMDLDHFRGDIDAYIPRDPSATYEIGNEPVAERQPIPVLREKQFGPVRRRLAIGAAAVAAGAVMLYGCSNNGDEQVVPTNKGGDVAGLDIEAVPTEACPETWEIVQLDHTGHRVVSEGIESIANAKTPEEARQAVTQDWYAKMVSDPEMFAGFANGIMNKQVASAELVDAEGKCATPRAEELRTELETQLALATITPDQAPTDGINTGVDGNGNMVVSSHEGITGDRRAVKVVLKDGTTFWVMARCGNPVKKGGEAPNLPKGPTDQPGPEQPKTPEVPTTLKPKDPSKNIDRNLYVPEQVRKNGPSPDNQDRINAGPTKPVDSPSGCDGPCPVPYTPPKFEQGEGTKVTVTFPESHGGNTGVKTPNTVEPAPTLPNDESPTKPVDTP